jgi:hypothetical protein
VSERNLAGRRRRRASPNAELALLLAGTERRRHQARGRILELATAGDPLSLATYLGERRLLALVGSRLLEMVPDAPPNFEGAVAGAIARSRLEAMAIDGSTAQFVSRLEAQAIPALPLKGPRLAEQLHGDPGMRASSDVDLLVPLDGLKRAVDIVRAEGYAAQSAPRRRDGLPELHFELTHPSLPSVEVHWRVHWYESRFSAAALANSRRGSDGVRVAQPLDELTMLLLFFARDGFYGLRHVADIAAWWDRYGQDGRGPGRLDGHVSRYPELARALRAAVVCADRHAGVPAGELLGPAPLGRRGRLAVTLGDWAGEGERDQLAANVDLIDGLLAPRGGLRDFVRRQLVPPPSGFLPRGAELPTGLAALRARAGRAARLLTRFALAVLRVRGGQAWRPLPPAATPPSS